MHEAQGCAFCGCGVNEAGVIDEIRIRKGWINRASFFTSEETASQHPFPHRRVEQRQRLVIGESLRRYLTPRPVVVEVGVVHFVSLGQRSGPIAAFPLLHLLLFLLRRRGCDWRRAFVRGRPARRDGLGADVA